MINLDSFDFFEANRPIFFEIRLLLYRQSLVIFRPKLLHREGIGHENRVLQFRSHSVYGERVFPLKSNKAVETESQSGQLVRSDLRVSFLFYVESFPRFVNLRIVSNCTFHVGRRVRVNTIATEDSRKTPSPPDLCRYMCRQRSSTYLGARGGTTTPTNFVL